MAQLDAFKNYSMELSLNKLSENQLTSPWTTGRSLWVNLYLLGKLKGAS